jgi:hypothetical protein
VIAGSVLAGLAGPQGLDYLGAVGSGFAQAELRDLTAQLLSLEQPNSPFASPVPADIARRARWTRPGPGRRSRLRRDHPGRADAPPCLARPAPRVDTAERPVRDATRPRAASPGGSRLHGVKDWLLDDCYRMPVRFS